MSAPTESDVLGYLETLSNWGRWGADDQLGTLNHVTPEKRRQAAALVSEGVSVSCAWDIETTPQPDHAMGTPQRHMVGTGEGLLDPDRPGGPAKFGGAMEFIGLVYHGFSVTHLDGLCHIFWEGKMYNGVPAAKVTAGQGATHHAITALAQGIVTRGVLLDVARAKGVDWLDPGYGVTPEDLDAAAAAQGVTIEPGDAVLLRTGYGKKKRETGRDALPRVPFPGWHASALPWIHGHDIAMIGADTAQDASPSGYKLPLPVHLVGIVGMGLWLIDNMNLEEVAAACAQYNRWTFQFVLAPLRVQGGTGSPANPLAVF
jgi:kynurenine formamidase